MEKYTNPELEIIKFNNEDILTTSSPGDNPINPDDPNYGTPAFPIG